MWASKSIHTTDVALSFSRQVSPRDNYPLCEVFCCLIKFAGSMLQTRYAMCTYIVLASASVFPPVWN